MNTLLQIAQTYWYVTLPVGGVLALAGINYDLIAAKVRKPKPRSVPAANIDELAIAMLAEACKLPPLERDETNKLIDGLRKITERSMIESTEPLPPAKVY